MSQTAIKIEDSDHVAASKEAIRKASKLYRGRAALACSFSAEDVVVLDLLRQVAPEAEVFALDTGRLNEETYRVAEAVKEHFGIKIDWYFPNTVDVEDLERKKGVYSFREGLAERKECCHIRKVEPLKRALSYLSAWFTGMRADQSNTRDELSHFAVDRFNDGILKVNPLAHWTANEVTEYVAARGLPVNELYSKGYASIGCAPCTRPIAPGEHERAGRWWWEAPEHKECGLHAR
jgi:phosphoadenosine phosphosulfate reductase